MDKLIIHGGSELNGEISISGSKNAVLPIMAATIIEPGIYTLKNVPNLRDTQTMMKLMEMIGANVIFSNNSLQINTLNQSPRPEEKKNKDPMTNCFRTVISLNFIKFMLTII